MLFLVWPHASTASAAAAVTAAHVNGSGVIVHSLSTTVVGTAIWPPSGVFWL